MNAEGGFFKAGMKYILAGVALILIVVVISVIPRREDSHDDTWMVEIRVVEKAISQIGGEDVYVIRAEDREGREAIYEINKKALNERLEVEGVYNEIKEGKYYKFKMADRDEYDSHYPVVCGAVSLIDSTTVVDIIVGYSGRGLER